MFNKRGTEYLGYYTILEFILLFLVAGAFAMFLLNLKSDTTFERTYMTKDLALMEHAIYAAPGDLDYNYYPEIVLTSNDEGNKEKQIELDKFDFEFSDNFIRIADSGTKDAGQRAWVSYYIYGDLAEITSEKPTSIIFEFRDDRLMVKS